MKPVYKKLAIPVVSLLLAIPLTGCSLFQSDSDFFGSDQPSAKTLTKDSLAKAHKLRLMKKYHDAVKILSQLVLADPDNAPVLAEYGKTLTEAGRSREAEEFLKRAIELKPADWTLYSALGVACDQQKQAAEAQDAYQKALELSPGNPAILNNYALSRLMAGDPAGAKRLIDQAMKADRSPRIAANARLIGEIAAAEAAKKAAQEKAAGKKHPPSEKTEDAVQPREQPPGSADASEPTPQKRPASGKQENGMLGIPIISDPVPQKRPDQN